MIKKLLNISTFIIYIYVASSMTFSHAASFDCGKAESAVEKMICLDDFLSNEDERLSLIYTRLMKISEDHKNLKTEQIFWLKNLRNKCKDCTCLRDSYKNRIDYLTALESEISLNNKKTERLVNSEVGKYVWLPDALNAIGDPVSRPEDKGLCEEFLKNINSFSSPYPMACGILLNPVMGDFRPIIWMPLDLTKNKHLIRDIHRFNAKRNLRILEQVNDDDAWSARFKDFKKTMRLDYVTVDIDHDGKMENLLKYYQAVDNKKCDTPTQSQLGSTGIRYFLADINLENLSEGGALFGGASGDLFYYKNKLYLTRINQKHESSNGLPGYVSDLRLSKISHSHVPMMSDDKCFYRFMWP